MTRQTYCFFGNFFAHAAYFENDTSRFDYCYVVINSTFTSNSAGGIDIYHGTATVSNSTFTANSVSSTGWVGGGIFNWSGTLTVSNSTFTGNSAPYGGGGIYNTAGTLTVSNSIVAGNTATDILGTRRWDPAEVGSHRGDRAVLRWTRLACRRRRADS